MTQLNSKPFEPESGFLRRIFKGFPAYYAKPDLEQYFDSFEFMTREHSKLLIGDGDGMVILNEVSGWNASKTIFTIQLNLTETFRLNFHKFSLEFSSGDFIYNDIVTFAGNSLTQADPVDAPTVLQSNIVTVLLTANKRIVTFAENPTVGGISGPTISSPLESSDVEEYYDFTLAAHKGIDIPDEIDGREVLCAVAQLTFYFDGYWKPMVIQNFRANVLEKGTGGKFPLINKWLGAFGQIDWLIKAMEPLNNLALRIDGSNMALTDLYVNKSGVGIFKIITKEDYATTTVSGIVRIANDTEVLDPLNNVAVLTPYGLYTALGASRKIYEIGVWDMDSLDSIGFPHNLGADWVKAVPSACSIYNDSLDATHNLFNSDGCTILIDDTYVYVERATGGTFDSVAFSSTGLTNRGYVILDIVGVTQATAMTPPTVSAGDDYVGAEKLTILLSATNVSQELTGSVTDVPAGALITNRAWSMLSGPAPASFATVPGEPDKTNVTFSSAGTYVIRYAVTISNGIDTAVGTDSVTIEVEAETAATPVISLKWYDGTTSFKIYTNENPRLRTVLAAGSAVPIMEAQWQIAYTVTEDYQLLLDYSAWEDCTAKMSPIPQSAPYLVLDAPFLLDRTYGDSKFRTRVKDANGVWSDWSNELLCNLDLLASDGLYQASNQNPLYPNTGAVGSSTIPSTVSATFRFANVSGALSNPTFRLQVTSEDYWVEYDPGNVQNLPPSTLNYSRTFLINISGSFNMGDSADRIALINAVVAKLQSFQTSGYTDPSTGITHPPLTFFTNVSAGSSGPSGNSMGAEGWDSYYLHVNFSVPRGSITPNQTLQTTSPPRLASRVRVTILGSDYSG